MSKKASSTVYDLLEIFADFDPSVYTTEIGRKQAIISILKTADKLNFSLPDFQPGMEWLNVSEPLSFSGHLKGCIVVLDFFTYCCINCLHILPDLEAIEAKFPPQSGVVVVGVHSAKFLNEKVTANILSAVLRHNIRHPVVNDKDAVLWKALAVSCWPTLMFVGPSGQLIYYLPGEGHRDRILEFLQVATEFYSSELLHKNLPISLEVDKAPLFTLHFPGKVCYWPEQNWLVIADTGNHRIVVTDTSGVIQIVIGRKHAGLKDGDFETAEFSSPQGVVCDKSNIYVADTGNHCLRKVDVELKSVTTLVGTGRQGTDKKGGKKNTDQEIASPWDLVLSSSPDKCSVPVLLIAMAGTHQIWVYFFKDSIWYSGRSYAAGTCASFAGSGVEENRNHKNPKQASFAQPSGLAVSQKDPSKRIYVADSESSSIRAISLNDCSVKGLIGGDRDPSNLFAFGDSDGRGIQAGLQHPLGVAYLDGQLFVADTYNHKIKIVNLNTLECVTYAGTGKPGAKLDKSDLKKCEFNEPGGVAVDENKKLIYVADTNNHSIKVINRTDNSIFQLPVVFSSISESDKFATDEKTLKVSERHDVQKGEEVINLPDVTFPATSNTATLKLPLNLPEGTHINKDAPNSWKICALNEASQLMLNSLPASSQKGNLYSFATSPESRLCHALVPLTLPKTSQPGSYAFRLTVQIFLCLNEQSVCLPPKFIHFNQVLHLF